MIKKAIQKTFQEILARADIKINGKRPWDIQIINQNVFSRVLKGGVIDIGESYVDGWWECAALDQLVDRVFKGKLDIEVKISKGLLWHIIISRIINQQRKSRAFLIGERHYDTGNELFKFMLDKRMNYSCGYWKNVRNLDEAQEAKLELICKKLKIRPGMKILDIGCGWGSFAKYIAEKYNVAVVGVTVSNEQLRLARELCKGLDIEIRLQDYRSLNEKFDCIVSIGMFEHVGYKNYKQFFKVVNRCLKNDGLFLLHTIGGNKSVRFTNPWINKYIFPNGMLPSANQITKAYEGIFKLEDWHNFGTHYDKTLMAWHHNFKENWRKIEKYYNERFYRMWNFYLLTCAGAFRACRNQLWQIVLSKIYSQTKYESIR